MAMVAPLDRSRKRIDTSFLVGVLYARKDKLKRRICSPQLFAHPSAVIGFLAPKRGNVAGTLVWQ